MNRPLPNLIVGAALTALAALISVAAVAQVAPGPADPNPVNLLDNGNFNVAQRGTTAVTGITTSPTYLWDRWAGVSGTATAETLTNVTSGVPAPFTNAAQVTRTSGQTGVLPVTLVQEIASANIIPLAGQPVTLSFWAKAATNLSSTGSTILAEVVTGTGTDERLTTYVSGFAGAASPVNLSQALTTSWQRFAVTGVLSATAKEAVVQIGFTPTGTAGTTDGFQVTGIQLQRGTTASSFEWRPASVELARLQAYYWQWLEPSTSTSIVPGSCSNSMTTVAFCNVPLHVQMRTTPTVTATYGTLKIQDGASEVALTALASPSTITTNADSVILQATVASGLTVGDAGLLLGGNSTGGGKITASADF